MSHARAREFVSPWRRIPISRTGMFHPWLYPAYYNASAQPKGLSPLLKVNPRTHLLARSKAKTISVAARDDTKIYGREHPLQLTQLELIQTFDLSDVIFVQTCKLDFQKFFQSANITKFH